MKMILVGLLSIFLIVGTANASPFLGGDVPIESNVVQSMVEVNGTDEAIVDIQPACTALAVGCTWTDPDTGQVSYIFRDLEDLVPGLYTFRGKWINDSGMESEYSLPFIFDTLVPTQPIIRLIP